MLVTVNGSFASVMCAHGKTGCHHKDHNKGLALNERLTRLDVSLLMLCSVRYNYNTVVIDETVELETQELALSL